MGAGLNNIEKQSCFENESSRACCGTKMASSTQTDVRKLRKKLRQIENLERLNRPLDQDEEAKIARKDEIRDRLQELLAYEEEQEALKNKHPSQCERDSLALATAESERSGRRNRKGIHHEVSQAVESKAKSENLSCIPGEEGEGSPWLHKTVEDVPKIVEEKAETKGGKLSEDTETIKNMRKEWKKLKVLVTELEGHSDLVTSLCFAGAMIVTGSRDTTVKVWDMETKHEIRSFGGHTEAVTSILVLSPDESSFLTEGLVTSPTHRIIVSASTDCTFRTWSVSSGTMLQSVYTFNPVTSMVYSYSAHKLVTASDGGKVELWDLKTAENVHSVQPHEASITGLKIVDSHVYSSCADGLLMVHEIRCNKLSRVFVSENVKPARTNGTITQRPVRSLEGCGSIILFGDDAFNIKLLDWKKGLVHKLPNHKTEFSSTDALCLYDNFLVSSSYDLDNGLGYLNVRTYPGGDYLATLDDEDTEKIVCVGCAQLVSGHMVIVTGGWQLKVWELLPPGSSGTAVKTEEFSLPTRYIARLAQPARDSEVESDVDDVDEDSDDDEEEEDGDERKEGWRGSGDSEEARGWLGWCSVL